MFFKTFLFITGIIQTGFSLSFILIYMNLLNMGYTFKEYVNFIFSRFECISFFIGVIFIIISLRRKEKSNDICV